MPFLFITCMPLAAPRSASMAFMGVLLERYPDAFTWFSLRGAPEPGAYLGIPAGQAARLWFSAWPQPLKQFLALGPWAVRQGRQAAAFGHAQGVQAVIADLAFESVVAGRVAAQTLGVPLLAWVHDDPVNRLAVKGYPAWLLRWYEGEFAKTLRAARQTAVISDAMGNDYRARYGVDTTTLYVGVDPEKCLPPRPLAPAKTPVVIGSVGSLNAAENGRLLVEALHLLNRQGARQYHVLQLGRPAAGLPADPAVENAGWLPEADFLPRLASLDVGFITWSFAPEHARTRQTSLPLKLHSYLQAGAPVFVFAPADSAVAQFVARYGCGAVCTQPDAAALAASLTALLEPAAYASAQAGVSQAVQALSRQRFYENFEVFVGL